MSKNFTLLDKVWWIKAQYAENQPVSMVVGGWHWNSKLYYCQKCLILLLNMNWNCKSFGLVLYVVIFVILIPISTSKMAISTNLIFKERRKGGSTM